MNYTEAKMILLSDRFNLSMPGTDRIKKVLSILGNPNDNIKCIHVVGSNGKGSVSTMFSSIFGMSGLNVGLFNSPYITELTEYISLNGKNMSEEDFAYYFNKVYECLSQCGIVLTHFEVITVMSVLYFADNNCDLCIYEAGMGGTSDATNVFPHSLLTILTTVSLEHIEYLGNTIESIISNKLGIAGRGETVLTCFDKYQDIIEKYCRDNQLNLCIGDSKAVNVKELYIDRLCFEYCGVEYNLNTGAVYQINNCITVINAIKIINGLCLFDNVADETVKKAFETFYIKSRFEIISKKPLIIVDGAHNSECAESIADMIKMHGIDNYILVTGVMKDKDYKSIYNKIAVQAKTIITIDNNIPRALKSDLLARECRNYCDNIIDARDAVYAAEYIYNHAEENTIVLFAGTLYMTDSFKEAVRLFYDSEYCLKSSADMIHRLTSKSFYSTHYPIDDMKSMLRYFNNPEESYKIIHVAGTNGKGSTCKMLDGLLINNNLNVGLFTSPYIKLFNERITFNDTPIEDAYLSYIGSLVLEKMTVMGLDLNQFAIITLIAFIYYRIKRADYVILETGLGGTYDPTNVVDKPAVSVITNIGPDHIAVLGDTISSIAKAKAGIIKKNVPVVVYPSEEEAVNVIINQAKTMKSNVIFADKQEISSVDYDSFVYNNYRYRIGLVGDYQKLNALTAIKTYEALINDKRLNMEPEYISDCLSKTSWPGRMEKLSDNPLCYVDGGHNVQCIENVLAFFEKYYPSRKIIVIAGFMKDKQYDEMIKLLCEKCSKIFLTQVNYTRSLNIMELTKIKNRYKILSDVSESLGEAFLKATEAYDDNSVIFITGSLYQINDAYNLFDFGGVNGRK